MSSLNQQFILNKNFQELALNDKELALIWPETIEELQNIVNEFILRSQSFPMKLDFAQELANECDEIIEMLTVLVSFFKLQVEINKAKNVVIDRLI